MHEKRDERRFSGIIANRARFNRIAFAYTACLDRFAYDELMVCEISISVHNRITAIHTDACNVSLSYASSRRFVMLIVMSLRRYHIVKLRIALSAVMAEAGSISGSQTSSLSLHFIIFVTVHLTANASLDLRRSEM